MFQWLRERQRDKILETPFPPNWREILTNRLVHYRHLDLGERTRLEQLTQVFVTEKNFEGCGGLAMTDEIRVVIAAQACILVLSLPHDLYRRVDSILVYPTTIHVPSREDGLHSTKTILGQAQMYGPIILVWDAVKRGAIHPERGHNVVYHEFAHKLDMLDGEVDGIPPLRERAHYDEWYETCNQAFEKLKDRSEKGRRTFLDPYGATHPAEFFAVATEYFFDKPRKMERVAPDLYEILQNYYNQDPATRERAHRNASKK